jgi:hypothetical protein
VSLFGKTAFPAAGKAKGQINGWHILIRRTQEGVLRTAL